MKAGSVQLTLAEPGRLLILLHSSFVLCLLYLVLARLRWYRPIERRRLAVPTLDRSFVLGHVL